MLIFFIWLGSVLPTHYYSTIDACENRKDYTCVLLGDGHFKHYYEKYRDVLQISEAREKALTPVEKSDILRYLYIYEHGGVYSDLDNVIDYDCLNEFLADPSLPESFFGEEQKITEEKPSNNFIYAKSPEDPEILRIMKCIKNCMTCPTLDFSSPYMLAREKARFVHVKKCVVHMYDSTWWPTSWFPGQKRPDWQVK